MISDFAREVFSHLCHQDPSRAWALGSRALPFCARCTGVYAGLAITALALPFARFKPSRAVLWIHGAAMLQIVVFGLHLITPQPAFLRTLSGSLFAAGAVYFLSLPIRARISPEPAGSPFPYAVAAIGAQVVLQVLLRIDRPVTALSVEFLALAGILVALALAICSAAAVAVAYRQRRSTA